MKLPALDDWAVRARRYAEGELAAGFPLGRPASRMETPRDVFAFFISEGKVRAPAAAMALADRLK